MEYQHGFGTAYAQVMLEGKDKRMTTLAAVFELTPMQLSHRKKVALLTLLIFMAMC